jgi:glycosyltransferase involved in cell wall biosynthesis
MTAISVVIPTYNRGSLIPETLDAVLAQTVVADEIIVVDDGSTDDTASVLERYGRRIRPIRIQNSGELVARNTGLRAARGRLLAFCDSDDLWTPDFLETMAAQWLTEPGLIACYADFCILQQDSGLSGRSKFADAPAAYWSDLRGTGPDAGVFDRPIVEKLLRFQPFFPSCMMASRAAFLDAGGWDEGVSRIIGCDLATTLRVAARPPIGVVRRPLVAIRKHAGNFSADTEKMNLGDANVLEHVLRTRPELAPLERAIRNSILTRRRAALDSAFSRRDFAAMREIHRILPRERQTAKQRVKRAIASLPDPLNTLVAALVSRDRP